ncbi:MAG: DNA translocase FtsK 4TM domain-containing protein [Thermodesulforhabdaceae bacterium]
MIDRRKKHELLGISIAFGSTVILLSLLSYSPSDPTLFGFSPSRLETKNWMGLFGSHLARLIYTPFGLASLILPITLFRLAWDIFWERKLKLVFYVFVPILGLVSSSILLSLFAKEIHLRGEKISGGGIVGEWITRHMIEIFSYTGTIIIVLGVGLCVTVAFLPWSLLEIFANLKYLAHFIGGHLSRFFSYLGKVVTNTISAIRAKNFRKTSSKNNKNSNTVRGKLTPVAVITSSNNFSTSAEPNNNDPVLDNLFASSLVESAPSIPSNRPSVESNTKKLESSHRPSSSPPSTSFYSFGFPSIDLLDKYETRQDYEDSKILQKKAEVLTQKLADFGVHGEVVNILPGPVITMFEYVPAPGIKISRIVNLQNDLTMALKAMSIRIVAPIPGKAAVGIEIPNAKRQLVSIRSVIESSEFQEATAPLTIALGKDTTGSPVATNLAKMPHLLIAGATGTGKSVCLNSILTSLLFRNTPFTLRLLLIDPKRIELSFYEGIPHLIHPVVTDVKKATKALQWAVEEMEQRYELMAQFNARNIEGYNKKVAEEKKQTSEGNDFKPLPYLVVIIDELADLMMVASREVEEYITRLAQMARAAGIHLVLATQRPSVDVITGLIKANIPSRISFQVSSKIDSRTILDAPGAETLLGSGDMLFLPPGTAKLQRIHGAFISDREVQRITDFWREQAKTAGWEPEHIDLTEDATSGEISDEDIDEKYEEAVKLVLETRQASISMLQRRLRVGYNRAARMIELMEKQGIVGPSDGIKPREVLGPPRNS